jgi:hypothetical protein
MRWLWGRSTVVLLLLQLQLLLLILRVIAPILLLMPTQLSYRWGRHHAVLQRSTAGPTTSRGSKHDPLLFLLFGLYTSLHGSLLVNGSTCQIVVGQVREEVQVVL